MKKLLTLFLSLALVVGVLAACGNKEDKDNAKGNNNAEELEMPEPDLEGIPDVVAEVNDEEISKEDFEMTYQQQFQNYALQAQMSGQSMDDLDQDEIKKDLVESMIGQQLIIQEANKKIKDVSDEDRDLVLDDLLEQYGMEDKDELFDTLEEQDMDKDDFLEQVETQVKVNKLLDDLVSDFEPSEDELKEAYDEMKEQQEAADTDEEVPEYDEMKDQLKEQMVSQKQSEKTNELVEKLRKDAKVEVHI